MAGPSRCLTGLAGLGLGHTTHVACVCFERGNICSNALTSQRGFSNPHVNPQYEWWMTRTQKPWMVVESWNMLKVRILKDHGQCKDKTVLGPADHTHVVFRDSIYPFSIHILCMFIKYTFQTKAKRTHLDHRFYIFIPRECIWMWWIPKSNGREPIERTHSASSKVPIMHVAPNCQHVTCAVSAHSTQIPCTTTLHLPTEQDKVI
jgi:hypothetical protein